MIQSLFKTNALICQSIKNYMMKCFLMLMPTLNFSNKVYLFSFKLKEVKASVFGGLFPAVYFGFRDCPSWFEGSSEATSCLLH